MPWPQRNTFRQPLNYVAACATELAAPLLRAYARVKVGGASPTSPQQWSKALVMGANHIGDVLYRTASLPALKQGLPHCEFDFIAPPPACEVLEGNPYIREIHRFEAPLHGARDERFQRLKQQRYDVALCYDNGTYGPFLKLAVDLGIPNRVTYVHRGFSAWVTRPVHLHFPQAFPGYFRDYVSELTALTPDWTLKPLVYPNEKNRQEADALWTELELDNSRPVVACFITTRQTSGVWPEEKFLETLEKTAAAFPIQIVLCGAPDDAEKLERFRRRLSVPSQINAGRLGLRALVAFLKKCRVVLGTDSGPRHMANAAGVPVLFVRNLWFGKVEAGAYCDTDNDMAPDVECVPGLEQAHWFDRVTTDEMSARLLKLLRS